MALCTIHFGSEALGHKTAMNVILPDVGSGPFPVYYLLHGLGDDYSTWLRRTSIERYIAGIPLIVVMPDGGRGFYSNGQGPGTARYEDHVVKDVIGQVDRLFPTISHRKGRVIGGASMGGYGAVKLALKYPTLFSAASSLSGALSGPPRKADDGWSPHTALTPEFAAIFGRRYDGGTEDVLTLAAACSRRQRPALHIDCGTSDFLIGASRRFHARLQDLRYRHQYVEHTGAHGWEYWDLHVQSVIQMYRRLLQI